MPFTQEQFFDVFRAYNAGVFPWQYALHVAALTVTLGLAFVPVVRRSRLAGRAAGALLAVLWAWMGMVYHFGYFLAINPAARLFGGLFVLQAIAFLVVFVFYRPPEFPGPSAWRHSIGGLLVVTGLVIYPLLNAVLGHGFLHGPTFGAPCPTTIFTMGILLMMKDVSWPLWIVPLAWTVLGGSAAVLLDVPQDYLLIAAGVAAFVALFLPQERAQLP